MTNILITGGAGFIGSNFVRYALREPFGRVVVVDKLTYAGNLASLEDVRSDPRFVFSRTDITDGRAMAEVFATHRPTYVVNLAAETHVDRSIDGPRAFVSTNVCGTFELLEASRALLRDVPELRADFRFLHVSTDEVYGTLGEEGTFSETTPYAPNSPYAATKAGADHLVRAYHETFGLPTLITNCSNNYGPYQYPEKLLPLMLLRAQDAKPLPIYGDGRNVRDWLYVEDHCLGLLTVLRRGRVGHKYNIGGGNERANVELVDLLCAILEERAPAAHNHAMRTKGLSDYRALKTFVADRPGHDRRYAIDATKVRAELGWSCRHGLEAGLRQTVDWYLANHDWCDAVQGDRYGGERLGLADKNGSS